MTVPLPRMRALMESEVTEAVLTSGSERLRIVWEKKVSTSMMLRKMMAAFFTQPRFLTLFSSMITYPFTEPDWAMPSTRYSSPCKNSSSDGII